MRMVTTAACEAALAHLSASPTDAGPLELIVRRPLIGERELVESADLSLDVGLVGDNWLPRGSRHTPDRSAEIGRQLTIMNSRAAHLFAGDDRGRWALAGDQLYVDLLLSDDNLPPGAQLRVGAAVVEVSHLPHNGCAKFRERFGPDAVRFANSVDGKRLHLRGVNAVVVEPGTVRVGDKATKQ